jgi:fatty acid desaturase
VIERLRRRSPWRASAAVIHDFVVLAVAIAAALYFWPNPIIVLISVVIIGTRQHALFVIAHDAAHYLLDENPVK